MSSNKQKWAQVRNWNKKMITGTKGALEMVRNSKATTREECYEIELALLYLDSIINFWDESNQESKSNYLEEL